MQIIPRFPKESARDYALRFLKHNIINLHLKPGTMVSVWELADIIGVSRTPIREAMQELEKTGILEIFPQAGSRISYIDYERIHESCFIRTTLETTIVELACGRMTREHKAEIEDILRIQRKTTSQNKPGDFLELDYRFHRQFYLAANRELTYQTVKDVLWQFDRLRTISFTTVDPMQFVREHEELYGAVKSGDKRLAKKLTMRHVNRYLDDEKALRAKYPEYFQKVPQKQV